MSPIDQVLELLRGQGAFHEPFEQIAGGDCVVSLEPSRLLPAIRRMLEAYPELHLSAMTARHDASGLVVLYHLWLGWGLSLRVVVPNETVELPSLLDDMPAADWYEREAHELYGIRFSGRQELSPLLTSQSLGGRPPMGPNRGGGG